MSRILETSVRCAVCGQSSDQLTAVSRYVPDHGLDGKPAGFDPGLAVAECPHCHYMAADLERPVDDAVRDYVHSTDFTRWYAAQPDPVLRRLEGAALLAARTDTAHAARWHLLAAWYCEDKAMPDEAERNRRQYLEMTLASGRKLTPDEMLPYLDSLRRLGRFEEGLALAGQLQPAFARLYEEQDPHRTVLEAEQRFLAARDAAPHMVSEVM